MSYNNPIIKKYFREDMLPHIWCPGCGNGILMQDIAVAIDNCGLDPDKVCIVSGIGCSSRAAGYMDFNTIHTTHGRAIAVATGVKMARPDLHVIVITGDGDAVAIGGNHFIHACRRNIDLTVVVFNNSIYGMTGGQFSPTTPVGDFATTAPYGVIDQDFDIVRLGMAAGATYVARGNAYHFAATTRLIEQGIKHKGFSVIDCISTCPTYYGRKNHKGSVADMMRWQKENTINAAALGTISEEEQVGRIIIGEFCNIDRPEYTEAYQKIIDSCAGEGSK